MPLIACVFAVREMIVARAAFRQTLHISCPPPSELRRDSTWMRIHSLPCVRFENSICMLDKSMLQIRGQTLKNVCPMRRRHLLVKHGVFHSTVRGALNAQIYSEPLLCNWIVEIDKTLRRAFLCDDVENLLWILAHTHTKISSVRQSSDSVEKLSNREGAW